MIAPLRKIVDRGRNGAGSNTETLECGHVVKRRFDHYHMEWEKFCRKMDNLQKRVDAIEASDATPEEIKLMSRAFISKPHGGYLQLKLDCF